jgi:hypothetical protein
MSTVSFWSCSTWKEDGSNYSYLTDDTKFNVTQQDFSLRLSVDKFVSVTLRVYVTIQVISSVKYAKPLPTSSQNKLQTVKSQQTLSHLFLMKLEHREANFFWVCYDHRSSSMTLFTQFIPYTGAWGSVMVKALRY